MEEVFIGENIRQRRMELGKTQEQLCKGLCEPSTLSRIETGKQAPSRNMAKALFQRLDLPEDRYYFFLTESEAEAEALRSAIDDCAERFHQLLGEEKHQARAEALEQLDKLEAITETDDNITRQYILAMRAALGRENGPYSFAARRKMLLEAIKLTVPQFDIESLDGRLYSVDEAEIIGHIAETYSEAGQHEKAAGIFNQLLTYVQEHFQDVTHPSRHLSPAAFHYARELCLAGRYKEAIEAAEMGQKACMDFGYCKSLPGLLAVMAECRYAMGEYELSRTLYCQAYYLFKETGNISGLTAVREAARKRLGPEFPLQGVLICK